MADVGCVPMGKLPSRHPVHACSVSQGSAMGETQLSVMRAVDCLGEGGEETEGQSLRKT